MPAEQVNDRQEVEVQPQQPPRINLIDIDRIIGQRLELAYRLLEQQMVVVQEVPVVQADDAEDNSYDSDKAE